MPCTVDWVMTIAFGYNINMQLISFCVRTLELCVKNLKDTSSLAFIMYTQTVIIRLVVAAHTFINMCNINITLQCK